MRLGARRAAAVAELLFVVLDWTEILAQRPFFIQFEVWFRLSRETFCVIL